MAMVSMERLVRFLSSFFISIVFFQCSSNEDNGASLSSKNSPDISNEKIRSISADNAQISFENNGVFYEEKPFSGKLFRLDPQSQDTLKIESYLKGNRHGNWVQYFPGHVLKEFRTFDQGENFLDELVFPCHWYPTKYQPYNKYLIYLFLILG